ncbi:MAG: quinone-dependent dihydroorotate dehydrogenase [Steroidobacteraceae bacterium]
MYSALRPLLFRLDAERAHRWTLKLLSAAHQLGVLQLALPNAGSGPGSGAVELMGLTFPNRVGLAAGYDKNAACVDALGTLGFGFIEVGTVTPKPQPGNARPRIFRIREAQAVVNRMGFPNEGVAALCAHLRLRRFRGVCGVNIGKNAATPLEQAEADYIACLRAVYPYADYVAVNVSSPNTAGLRELEREARLAPLLESLLETRSQLTQEHGRRVPLLVKLSPDLSDEELAATAAVIGKLKLEGVIATNTTIRRPSVADLPHAREAGGLSGAPLLELTMAAVRRLRTELGAEVPIIGVGGIGSAADALQMRAAGADLVQVYTGLVYRGPRLVRELSQL